MTIDAKVYNCTGLQRLPTLKLVSTNSKRTGPNFMVGRFPRPCGARLSLLQQIQWLCELDN
jgi:hypothetical protein